MKIYKKITYLLGWIILSTAILASCDYLNVVPPETASFKDTMKDRNAALGFLYSCYAGVVTEFQSQPWHYYQAADEYALPPLWNYCGQITAWNELSETNQGNPNLPWNNCYDNLNQCHLFLKALNELNPSGVTSEDRTRWKAEIEFLQAYYHTVLLDAYGPIPLMTHYYDQDTPTSSFPGRTYYDVCVDSIVSWLDDAATNLPATVDQDELGRATSTICKALKARVLLYAASPLWNGSFPYPNWKNTNYETPGYGKELVSHTYDAGKWQSALNACNDAISLATGDGGRTMFSLSTSEQIRAMEGVPLPTIPNVTDSTFRKRVMLMRYLMTTTEDEGNKEVIWGVIDDQNNPNEIPIDAIPHAVTTYNNSPVGGWSGISPYLFTIEHFYTANGLPPKDDANFPAEDQWFSSAGLSNSDIIKLNVNREPRFYAWMGFDGGEYSSWLSNGSPLVIVARNSQKQGYNPSLYNRDNNVTGYWNKKWVQPNIKWRSSDGGNNMSVPPYQVIRLAELYLDRAECYAALGDEDNALADLNVVRERAGVPDLTATVVANSSMSLMDWVRNERFIELWGEAQRYFDLRRWMIAPQYLKTGTREGLNAMQMKDPSFSVFNQPTKVDQPFEWTDRMYLLPVQSSELYSNPQLIQAPGY